MPIPEELVYLEYVQLLSLLYWRAMARWYSVTTGPYFYVKSRIQISIFFFFTILCFHSVTP